MAMKRIIVLQYQCSYMFRPREAVFRVPLEHFKGNIQIALLEMRTEFLNSVFTVCLSVFLILSDF